MVEIRCILCPVDFSDTSRRAIEHAVAVAKWYGSKIVGLHVMSPPLLVGPPILLAGFADLAAPESGPAADRLLHEWLRPATEAGLQTEVLVQEGVAAVRILETAASLRADMIVMGTHGRGGFERFWLGSVAEKVLRKASCPVWTVPPPAVTPATFLFKRLLCPVDFSDSSLAALRYALSIAKESDAHLTLLYISDWPPENELLIERLDTPELRAAVEEEARDRFAPLITDEVRTWCKPEVKVAFGKAYRQILEHADNEGSDLIVMGARGHHGLDRTVFGSTTNQVVRRARCPVLTLTH